MSGQPPASVVEELHYSVQAQQLSSDALAQRSSPRHRLLWWQQADREAPCWCGRLTDGSRMAANRSLRWKQRQADVLQRPRMMFFPFHQSLSHRLNGGRRRHSLGSSDIILDGPFPRKPGSDCDPSGLFFHDLCRERSIFHE